MKKFTGFVKEVGQSQATVKRLFCHRETGLSRGVGKEGEYLLLSSQGAWQGFSTQWLAIAS